MPLADATLLKLAEGVLAADEATRLQLFESAILTDPAFALWCIARAWRDDQAIALATDCAHWLSDDCLLDICKELDDVAEDIDHWIPLIHESFALRLASDESSLRAMLSNALRWHEAIDDSTLSLPPCFADEHDEVSLPESSDSDCDELTAAWSAEHSGAASLLKRAVEMRMQLSALEQHWDQELLHAKLASLKEFTYGASHELNNPLFNISSRAQVLLRDEEDPDRRRKLSTIYAHAMRASEMINDIALAARPPKPEFDKVDLSVLLTELVRELTPAAEEQATQLTLDSLHNTPAIDGDREQIALALREIVVNALEGLRRSTRRGEITISSTTINSDVEIVIADNGPSMDERARRHMFDPFFSGYESGRGLGFGLTKCWQIIQAHGGVIVVDSQPDRGTTCTIRLPRTQSPVPARQGNSRG